MHDASVVGAPPTGPLVQGLGAVSWASPENQSRHECFVLAPQYGTVVIDDTLRKMRELPHNVLVVPPFEEDAVKKGTDDIMDYVKVYLDMLLDEEVQDSLDVRETLKARPLRLGFL